MLKADSFHPLAMAMLNVTDYMHTMPITLPSMLITFLSIPTHQSPEISFCPSCNPYSHVPSYLKGSILILDHYLRSFPSHCLAYCLSIAIYFAPTQQAQSTYQSK
jgi:hypothetical protein